MTRQYKPNRRNKQPHATPRSIKFATAETVIFGLDEKSSYTIKSVSTTDGREKWSLSIDSKDVRLLPFYAEGLILAVKEEKQNRRLSAYDLETGVVRWEKSYAPVVASRLQPISTPFGIVHFYDGVETLTTGSGASLWKRDDLRLKPGSPPVQNVRGDLFLIDAKNTLHLLSAKTGKTLASSQQAQTVDFTNIFPYGKRVYLRGTDKAASSKPHVLYAIKRSNGKLLWKYSDTDPSLSNLIEEKGRLFFGTQYRLIALDLKTGGRYFKKTVSDTGRAYPVHIKSFSGKIVFISELVIAGFDPRTGRQLYRYGMTPLSELTTIEGLDRSIKRVEARLKKASMQQSGPSMSKAFSDQAAIYQNSANNYFKLSRQARSNKDFWKSEMHYNSAQIDSAFAKMNSQLAFASSMMELADALKKAIETAASKKTIKWQKLLRRSILSSYNMAEWREYAFRPNSDFHFVGVTVVHLPTGRMRRTKLSVQYQDYGLWNLIDFERGVVFHNGIGLDPDQYRLGEPFYNYGLAKVLQYDSFLIARPIRIPGPKRRH